MTAFLRVNVTGQQDLEKKVKAIHDAVDTRAILDEGAAVLFNKIRTRFLQQVNPDGIPWKVSQAALRRAKRNLGGGTLFDTGKLWRSLQLYAVGSNSRAIGTDVTSPAGFPYPLVHNYGLAGFPERQFLGFGDSDVQSMSDVILKRLVKGLAA